MNLLDTPGHVGLHRRVGTVSPRLLDGAVVVFLPLREGVERPERNGVAASRPVRGPTDRIHQPNWTRKARLRTVFGDSGRD